MENSNTSRPKAKSTPTALPRPTDSARVFQRAREVIRIEADAVLGLLDQLDDQFVQAAA